MTKTKRIVSALLIMVMTFALMAPCAMASDEDLSQYYLSYTQIGLGMPYQPADKYVSDQNPPSFRWPFCKGATAYDIVVCNDPELKDVAYIAEKVPYNYHNFDVTFETGKFYYWAARPIIGGKPQAWSTARRFKISPDAHEFVLPDMKTIMSRLPEGHPRFPATKETLEEFRSYKDTNEISRKAFESNIQQADLIVAENTVVPEPKIPANSNYVEYWNEFQVIRDQVYAQIDKGKKTAWAYMMTGDTKYSDYAKKVCIELSKWDINGVTSYQNQDQLHRSMAYEIAEIYDKVYDTLTPSEKQTILKMIKDRTEVMIYLLDSIPETPYDSHGWTAYGYIGIVALATYGDIPEAEGWLERIIRTYTSVIMPWSYQDGGWSQGPGYWGHSTGFAKEFMNPLALSGILNLYETAWAQNEYLWMLYVASYQGCAFFGDGSGNGFGNGRPDYTSMITHFTKNPVAKWMYQRNGEPNVSTEDAYWQYMNDDVVAQTGENYPNASEFTDIGWTTMSNSVNSPNRIHMTFKSSPFGSYNHSHADQNAFAIYGYGKALAINSGNYDSYHSPHDSGFTRKTHAHNSVSVATSQGQQDDSILANGHLTNFINHADFDLSSGDATAAYNGKLGKFERHIIYLRPEVYVVIDDLKAAPEKESKFEWWLNALHDMEVYNSEEGTNGARITEDGVLLDARVQYPENITTYYNDIYAGSDMVEIKPEGASANNPPQRRVWFETEKVKETKMIVTLDIHKEDTEAKFVDTETYEDYVKMTFPDGSVILVNLKDAGNTVTAGDISFDGVAVAYKDQSIMLVSGTTLTANGIELVKAEKPMSVAIGRNELSISTYDDNRVSIHTNNDYVQGVNKVTNYWGTEMSSAYGLTYEDGILTAAEDGTVAVFEAKDYVTFSADKDNYTLMLNGKSSFGGKAEGSLTIVIDGEETTYPMEGLVNRDGTMEVSTTVNLNMEAFQVLEMSERLIFGSASVGYKGTFGEIPVSSPVGENRIVLKTIETNTAKVERNDDHEAVKGSLAVFKEAEDFKDQAEGSNVYSNRPFLSGGKGVQLFNNQGTTMTYDIEIPEAGTYDFAVKYVAWEPGGAVRSMSIGDKIYVIPLDKTPSYGATPSDWTSCVAKIGVELQPGTYTISMTADSGMWNFDWIGFIKR